MPIKMLMDSHERIFQILYKEDEVTWQSLLYELIKKEGMNPWDINISLLTKKYIEIIKKLKNSSIKKLPVPRQHLLMLFRVREFFDATFVLDFCITL